MNKYNYSTSPLSTTSQATLYPLTPLKGTSHVTSSQSTTLYEYTSHDVDTGRPSIIYSTYM